MNMAPPYQADRRIGPIDRPAPQLESAAANNVRHRHLLYLAYILINMPCLWLRARGCYAQHITYSSMF
jgi:hypothetical protein